MKILPSCLFLPLISFPVLGFQSVNGGGKVTGTWNLLTICLREIEHGDSAPQICLINALSATANVKGRYVAYQQAHGLFV